MNIINENTFRRRLDLFFDDFPSKFHQAGQQEILYAKQPPSDLGLRINRSLPGDTCDRTCTHQHLHKSI